MAEEMYRIVFRGELVEGVSRAEAEANLKSRFKYSDAALSKLFAGKGVVLKTGLDQATAYKYEKALAGVGLVCEVAPIVASDVSEPVKAAPVAEAEPVPQVPVAQEEAAPAEPEPLAEKVAAAATDPFAEAEPVQKAFEETVAPQQSVESVAEDNVFGTDAAVAASDTDPFAESASVQEEFEEPVVPPQPAASIAADDVFETGAASAAADASFFEESPVVAGPVSITILEILQKTKPWVRFISILLFISSALGVLAIAGLLIGTMLGGLGLPSDTPTLLMFAVQMFSLLLYLIPAYYLFKYASAIGDLLKGGGGFELETALGYQKSFWRFSGILALICLGLAVLGFLAAFLVPVLMR